MAKWQNRWENSSTGRTFYEFVPSVHYKRQLDSQDKTSYKAILQLRTGYSILNAHRHKIGINVSPLCACGILETTDHFLLDCPIHESHREALLTSLQRLCGISTLDKQTLLGTEDHPHIYGWRDMIQAELATYIQATDRFAAKTPDCDRSRSDIHN